MNRGNGLSGVPVHQIATFKCPHCGDEIFESMSCVRLVYDRLDSNQALHPVPVILMRCLACGRLIVSRGGKWIAVEVAKPSVEGDEWKTTGTDPNA